MKSTLNQQMGVGKWNLLSPCPKEHLRDAGASSSFSEDVPWDKPSDSGEAVASLQAASYVCSLSLPLVTSLVSAFLLPRGGSPKESVSLCVWLYFLRNPDEDTYHVPGTVLDAA